MPRLVYFIQAGDDGPIKIGIAANPDQRLDLMQVGNHQELHLVAVIPGTIDVERAYHERFKAGRIRGEWFASDTPGLAEAVARACELEVAYWSADGRVCPLCLTPVDRLGGAIYCSPECARLKAAERQRNERRTRRAA